MSSSGIPITLQVPESATVAATAAATAAVLKNRVRGGSDPVVPVLQPSAQPTSVSAPNVSTMIASSAAMAAASASAIKNRPSSGPLQSTLEGEGEKEQGTKANVSQLPYVAMTSAPEQTSPPYITITNMTANIDSGIDNFVEQIAQRNPLREISVNERTTASGTPKFTRIDGDFPKSTVPLYEQMVYHRAGSMNLKPLEIFIPTRYKINFDQINEYFTEMNRKGDQEIQELTKMVIDAYGNNNNSLFYKHTLPGKSSSSRELSNTTSTVNGIFDLDKETANRIQFKIDKWHKNYTDWRFYKNANHFFVENKPLPKEELITLKMEFGEVFDTTKGKGLMKLIEEIGEKHDEINDVYKNYGTIITETILKPVISQYITFFKVIYEDIKKHMTDTTDFIRGRQHDLGYDYKFDEAIKTTLFKTYSDMKEVIESFGDNIQNMPYLKLMSLFQIFTQKIGQLNQQFPTRLKDAFDSSIAKNGRIGNREYYKTYTLIQYIYWLLSNRGGSQSNQLKDPFHDNSDDFSPADVLERADIKSGNTLYPEPKYVSYFQDYPEDKQRLQVSHLEEDERILENAAVVVKTVESDKKHVLRLIEIYKKNVTEEMKAFIDGYMSFDNKTIRSYNDIHDKTTVSLPFGIDLLFYVLYFTTNQVVSSIKRNKALFDKIDDKNGDLQILRQDIQLKESKLTHIFDMISKLTGIPVERIIPDRVNYYASNTNRSAGLIENHKYHAAWEDRLSTKNGGGGLEVAKKINYVTRKMKDGLDKSLGIIDDANEEIHGENDKKMKAALITLLEHNTVQVIHMLFAKPRDIWYSPDMRNGSFTSSPKWIFFRLEKPEIISKGAFAEFQKEWNKEIDMNESPNPTRLDFVLNKDLKIPRESRTSSGEDINEYERVFKIKRVDDEAFKNNSSKKGFCVFIIATQPTPQTIEPNKDSANDSRFQISSFSTGETKPTTNDDASLGNKLMQKLNQVVKPNTDKCNNVRSLIQEQINELSLLTKDALKAAGVDLSIKMTGLKDENKVTASKKAAKKALELLIIKDITSSQLQKNVDEAYNIVLPYKGYPDCDAVIGYCLYLGGNKVKQDKDAGLRLIIDSANANSKYGEFMIGMVGLRNAKTNTVPTEITTFLNENTSEPVDYLKRAAQTTGTEEGLVYAKVELVEQKREGNIDDTILPDTEAVQLIQSAADEGYAPAEVILGEMHKDGELGLPEDDKKAAELFESASSKGDDSASLQLGEMYRDGRGVPQDEEKARKLFEKATGSPAAGEKGENPRSVVVLATAALAALLVAQQQKSKIETKPVMEKKDETPPREREPVEPENKPVEPEPEHKKETIAVEEDDNDLLEAAAKTTALFFEEPASAPAPTPELGEPAPEIQGKELENEIIDVNDIPIDVTDDEKNVEGTGGIDVPEPGSYVSVDDDERYKENESDEDEDTGAGVFGALKQPPPKPLGISNRSEIMKRLKKAQFLAENREKDYEQRKELREKFPEIRKTQRKKAVVERLEQKQKEDNEERTLANVGRGGTADANHTLKRKKRFTIRAPTNKNVHYNNTIRKHKL